MNNFLHVLDEFEPDPGIPGLVEVDRRQKLRTRRCGEFNSHLRIEMAASLGKDILGRNRLNKAGF